MKKKLMITGGCLVAGMLSCSMLVAAVKCAKDETPVPVVAASPQKTGQDVSAKDGAQTATAPAKERRRKRARKSAPVNVEDGSAEAPRKRRTRKARRPIGESGNAENEM